MIPFIFVAICFCRVMFYLSQKKNNDPHFSRFSKDDGNRRKQPQFEIITFVCSIFFPESHDFFQSLKFLLGKNMKNDWFVAGFRVD